MAIREELTGDNRPVQQSTGDRELATRLREHFEQTGAKLDIDNEFAQHYLLDFTITRFEGFHAHVNLGVHITNSIDNLHEQQQFFRASQRGIVLKAIYIEMSEVAIDAGGLLVAFGACLAYLFDRRYTQNKAVGLRVFEDSSFNFFDLQENIERLQRMSFDEDLDIGEALEGRIIAYFTEKGFGFIQTDEERKFFFHIANVVDDSLRARLPAYIPGEVIPVDFQYGGNDGKKYPKAINIALPEGIGNGSSNS